MSEKIGIKAVSDLITAKSGREYFTIENFEQRKYVCFIPKLKDFCLVGSEIEADITPGKTENDSPRLDMIYVNGKPMVSVEKPTGTGRSYGKSDKELLQQRQIEEVKRKSIEAQVALKGAVDLAVAGTIERQGEFDLKPLMLVAREFYQLLQSLTQISEAEVIYKKIKGDKDETKTHQGVVEAGEDETVGVSGHTTGVIELDPSKVMEGLEIPEFKNASEGYSWVHANLCPEVGLTGVKKWIIERTYISDNPSPEEFQKVAKTLMESK